jgi:DNA invertase Pin-like site-specific DNA recombinase
MCTVFRQEKTIMKVAIYSRVSTSKQDNGNQLIQLREFAAKQKWQVVTEYVDTVSGSGKTDRLQFERMMLAASQKQFDVLVFWKLDRFTREGTRRTLAYLTWLDAWGVAWRSYSEPFFDSCGVMRDVIISIMATLAEQERISISERTKAGLARARRSGKVLGRTPYAVDMVAVRAKQKAGQSLRGIARDLGVSAALLVIGWGFQRLVKSVPG